MRIHEKQYSYVVKKEEKEEEAAYIAFGSSENGNKRSRLDKVEAEVREGEPGTDYQLL